jgi:hypothetical protein
LWTVLAAVLGGVFARYIQFFVNPPPGNEYLWAAGWIAFCVIVAAALIWRRRRKRRTG